MSYFELPEPRRGLCPFCDNVAGRVSETGHAPTLLDLTDEEAAAIMRDTRRAALAVTRAFKPTGLTIYQNNGVGTGHEIPHVHMHVVPRHHNDDGAIPRKGPAIPYAERAEVAARIKRFIP